MLAEMILKCCAISQHVIECVNPNMTCLSPAEQVDACLSRSCSIESASKGECPTFELAALISVAHPSVFVPQQGALQHMPVQQHQQFQPAPGGYFVLH